MECRKVQEAILESLEDAGYGEGQREIDAHLAGCPVCAEFAARQKTVDARLHRMLIPPEMSPGFRKVLRKRIRREAMHVWSDSLPDRVHFVSCGLVTLLCAIFMPFAAAAVLSGGATATVVTYILLTEARNSLEDSEDPGQ